jgi:hypothetical protein
MSRVKTAADWAATAVERFWAKVDVRGPDECWPWTSSSKNRRGYGIAWFDLGSGRKTQGAHRVAFFIQHGRPPAPGLDVMHSCDDPGCCNPAHLSEGTRTDNMRDAARKGRTRRTPTVLGEACHTARLTAKAAREIRASTPRGGPYASTARRYGVSPEVVGDVVRGKTWRHV